MGWGPLAGAQLASGARAEQGLPAEERRSLGSGGHCSAECILPARQGLLWTRLQGEQRASPSGLQGYRCGHRGSQHLRWSRGKEEERLFWPLVSRLEEERLPHMRPGSEDGGVHPRQRTCGSAGSGRRARSLLATSPPASLPSRHGMDGRNPAAGQRLLVCVVAESKDSGRWLPGPQPRTLGQVT